MSTFPKKTISIRIPESDVMSYAVRRHLEAGTQVFIASAPIKIASGLVTASMATVDTAVPAADVIFGIAVRAGQNATASTKKSEFVPMVDGMEVFANLLSATAGGDNALAAADVGGDFELRWNPTGAGSAAMWHAVDLATAATLQMTGLETDIILPNIVGNTFAVAADTNARVSFAFIEAARQVD